MTYQEEKEIISKLDACFLCINKREDILYNLAVVSEVLLPKLETGPVRGWFLSEYKEKSSEYFSSVNARDLETERNSEKFLGLTRKIKAGEI